MYGSSMDQQIHPPLPLPAAVAQETSLGWNDIPIVTRKFLSLSSGFIFQLTGVYSFVFCHQKRNRGPHSFLNLSPNITRILVCESELG